MFNPIELPPSARVKWYVRELLVPVLYPDVVEGDAEPSMADMEAMLETASEPEEGRAESGGDEATTDADSSDDEEMRLLCVAEVAAGKAKSSCFFDSSHLF